MAEDKGVKDRKMDGPDPNQGTSTRSDATSVMELGHRIRINPQLRDRTKATTMAI